MEKSDRRSLESGRTSQQSVRLPKIDVSESGDMVKFTLSELTESGQEKGEILCKKSESNRSSAAALHDSLSADKCDFCNMENHTSVSCYMYLDLNVQERPQLIEQSRFCLRCLSNSHVADHCESRCTHCEGDNHVILCFVVEIEKGQSGVGSDDCAELTVVGIVWPQ